MTPEPSSERYTDGFLLPLSPEKTHDYREVARKCAAIWKEHGALSYVETIIDEDGGGPMRTFASAAGAGPEETVILAWITYPSKEVRDNANAKIMEDPRMKEIEEAVKGLFDCSRMVYGGFKPIVEA